MQEMSNFDKTIIVHRGALGDFFQAWPAIWNLRLNLPDADMCWGGRGDYFRWVGPLGITRCSPAEQKALDGLYLEQALPSELEDRRVVWFGLKNNPLRVQHERVWFLPGIQEHGYAPPREVYAGHIRDRGLAWNQGWLSAWRGYFLPEGRKPGETAVIFPGAGHPSKQWPLVKFFELARLIAQTGLKPLFVLGPAEIERGMEITGFDEARFTDLDDLTRVLTTASVAVGNDCGPMHLAGFMGVPGVVIFGPTAPKQWTPPGMTAVYLARACSPCSRTGKVDCGRPECLFEIGIQAVLAALKSKLSK